MGVFHTVTNDREEGILEIGGEDVIPSPKERKRARNPNQVFPGPR
jgi:hypothetical protein